MNDLNEPILSDDYSVHCGFLYVADGEVIASDWDGLTVADLKRKLPANEIRHCDMFGRGAILKAAEGTRKRNNVKAA